MAKLKNVDTATQPDATTQTNEAIVATQPIAPNGFQIAPPVESEKLTELRAQKLKLKQLARTFEPDSVDEESALMEAYKTEQLIKAEIAAIKANEAKQQIEILRNNRVQLFDNAIAAYVAMTANDNNDTKAAFAAAREIVVNELLAKHPTSKAATKTANGEAQPTNGSRSELINLHVQNLAAGLDDSSSRKAIEAAGHARSTVWFAVDAYNKSK